MQPSSALILPLSSLTASVTEGQQAMGMAAFETAPPPEGVSVIGQDGFMVTSAPVNWQEPRHGAPTFEIPNVFHPRWSVVLPGTGSTPPPAVEPSKRPSTIPPPGNGRDKTLRIIAKALFKELKEQGCDDRQILRVASESLSLLTDMLIEDGRRERRDSRKSNEVAEPIESPLNKAVAMRLRSIFWELKEAGYSPKDLISIPTELIGQVTQASHRAS